MSNVTKSRLYGFHDVVDSEAMFVRLLLRSDHVHVRFHDNNQIGLQLMFVN